MSGQHHARGGRRTVTKQAAAHAVRTHGPRVAASAAKVVSAKSAQRQKLKVRKAGKATTRYDRDVLGIKLAVGVVAVLVVLTRCGGSDTPQVATDSPTPPAMCEDAADLARGTFPCPPGMRAQ